MGPTDIKVLEDTEGEASRLRGARALQEGRKARVLVRMLVLAHSSQNCGFVSNLPRELWKAHMLSLLYVKL